MKIKITDNAIVTKDDKGNLSLIGNAKEALASFSKLKINVTIGLHDNDKDKVTQLLKDNNVPYTDIIDCTKPDDDKKKDDFDLIVIGGNKVVVLEEWRWTAERVVSRLFDKTEPKKELSVQERMDKNLAQIKKLAQERSKKKSMSTDIIGY